MKEIHVDYKARINRVCESLGAGALLQLSTPESIRNSDVHHNWRQNSLFHWLTGFNEPQSAVLIVGSEDKGNRVHLFLRDKDAHAEMWSGRRVGVKAASEVLEIDHAPNIEDLWTLFPKLLGKADKIYYEFGDSASDKEFTSSLALHKHRGTKTYHSIRMPILDPNDLAGEMRLIKDSTELEIMRLAAAATTKGFDALYNNVRPGMTERQAHAILIAEFLGAGAEMEAYPSIVAGGDNACILHYIENNQVLKEGDLLLVDAGSQFNYYASDVTRTFPVGKTFSPEQKSLYEIVLEAEVKAIEKVRLGFTWLDMHQEAISVVVDGLMELGFFKESKDEVIEKEIYKEYFPHGTGHWLGMDVHDVGAYASFGTPQKFEAGMVTTVEPGIYVPPHSDKAPKAYLGIGIRIEDDVVVTNGDPEVLTKGIRKSISELENR